MKAHCLDMPMLAGTKQFTRATDLQVAHGNRVPRAQLRVFGNDFEALLSFLRGSQLPVTEKVGVRPRRSASNATAQLVELRQPESVGAIHDEGVRVRDVQ